MGQNRMEELLRCPTLEQPSLEYFEVRLPWQSFAVRRETAERVLEAAFGIERAEWVRLETMGGSVAWIRAEHVVFVREWSSAQRESERRFWKEIDAEYEKAEKATEGSEGPEGQPDAESGAERAKTQGCERAASQESGTGRIPLGTILLTLWVLWLVLALIRAAAVR